MTETTSDHHKQHISQQFNAELTELRNHFLVMGGKVEKLVDDSIEALTQGNSDLADKVRMLDDEIDEMEMSIDEECTHIIARRQPTASDLRLVMSIVKMVADLERVGDEATKIAKMAMVLSEEGQAPRGYPEIRHISNHVTKMLRDSLDAFARFDTGAAIRVLDEDRSVDKEYKTATRSLVTFMMEDPRSISRILSIMWVLRALERIGDHACNIAEQVIYMVKGKDIRHTSIDEAKEIVDQLV